MKDNETIDEFYSHLNEIVNSIFNLREKILENSIVRKIMRSLFEKFRPKATAIDRGEQRSGHNESRGTCKITLDL